MIKYFRKIRYELMEKSKTGKYFKYALGEIVLVVIGILIALSVSNWNAERINENRNHTLLVKLSKELDLNIERASFLDTVSDAYGRRGLHNDSILKILESNSLVEHYSFITERPIFYVNAFNLNTSVFEELKNTGSLYAIGTDSLVTEIQRYYQLCDRESFYNLNYSQRIEGMENKCFDGWFDFKYLYERNPEEALKHHPWVNDPRAPQFIHFRQLVAGAGWNGRLMSHKLKGIVRESEKLKELIAKECLSK